MCQSLIQKYNIPGPRYTSYPTVPYWDNSTFSLKNWKQSVIKSFKESNTPEGISLYIHLPFCESMCTFCGCNKRITQRHDVELPYLKALLKEWQLYLAIFPEKPRVKEIHLGGGTPTFFSPENLKFLMKELLRKVEVVKNHQFSFEGHPNNTTKAHLEALYEVGFTRVSYGVQDYDKEVQKAIHRIQPFEKVKTATEETRAIGFTSVGHDIIFGLPFQTIEAVEKTILKTKELLPDRIAFYSYAHVPWIKGNGQRGYNENDLPSAEEKRKQYELGKKLLEEIGYLEIGMDHFALPTDELAKSVKENKLHRNFMGYNASKTQLMVGLGVSSISDSWYGFSQNVKGVEEYQHLVNENILPVFKGHILTKEDLTIRQHILNLMCHLKTQWIDNKELMGLPGILERLTEMENDGLLKRKENTLEITEKGRPFVRNICMAFDLRLQENKPETRLFSMTV
ncbi:oxygen-independent coproporphyrinogen III oxidase [Mesonia aquimarina]|uniref:oxygen-independent coproporphyrinogen III oxidase n=1 Tax=Mesonia aquimarina TaxID=1504967 RepID=UPI000EF63448|nr:oxygen-independent coproporphyrinogen III oxidase [Mesonia aquimarina]